MSYKVRLPWTDRVSFVVENDKDLLELLSMFREKKIDTIHMLYNMLPLVAMERFEYEIYNYAHDSKVELEKSDSDEYEAVVLDFPA